MAVRTSTRTIHTITIDIPDDALAQVESGDDIEIVLVSRYGPTAARRLAYRDRYRLVGDDRR